jgi:hypothetical protein
MIRTSTIHEATDIARVCTQRTLGVYSKHAVPTIIITPASFANASRENKICILSRDNINCDEDNSGVLLTRIVVLFDRACGSI